MTQQEAINALKALTEKGVPARLAKNNAAYRSALAAVENPGIEQVCGKNTGSGRWSSSTSWLDRTADVLNRLGIGDITMRSQGAIGKTWYIKSNVAPNGGKHGDRITVIFG